MAQRIFQAEADSPIPDGFWPGEPIEAESRGELESLLLDAAAVLDRIGGTFSVVAVRQELLDVNEQPTGLYVTVGFRAKWESFAPAVGGRRTPERAAAPVQETPAPAPAPEPDPEPDPEAEAEADEDEPQMGFGDDDFGPDAEAALAAAAEQG